MEKLVFDIGVKEYKMPGGVLRFNPADPNLYARFLEAVEKIRAVETEMVQKAKNISNDEKTGEEVVRIMHEADRRIKTILDDVFVGNNFDRLLVGVNLLAVTAGGTRVVENLMGALLPVMESGAKQCVDSEVAAAKLNREQRRALQ